MALLAISSAEDLWNGQEQEVKILDSFLDEPLFLRVKNAGAGLTSQPMTVDSMREQFKRLAMATGLGVGMGDVAITTYCLRRNFVTALRRTQPKEIIQVSG